MLVCPVCKKRMIVLELSDIEIDYCTECKGIWLDKGELDLLTGGKNETNLFDAFFPSQKIKEKKRKCPICLKKMAKHVFKHKEKQVLLDACGDRHGIWFDEGELLEIVSWTDGIDSRVLKLLTDIFRKPRR